MTKQQHWLTLWVALWLTIIGVNLVLGLPTFLHRMLIVYLGVFAFLIGRLSKRHVF